MSDKVIAFEASIADARKFLEKDVVVPGYPCTAALQLAVDSRQGIYPDRANDLSFIAAPESDVHRLMRKEARIMAVMKGIEPPNPIAYIELDDLNRLSAQMTSVHYDNLRGGDDYGFIYELANRLAPKLHLIKRT